MDKCRICFKYSKKLRSIHDSENGITYSDMITSIANVKIFKENMFPDQICGSCRKKLREAYIFKEDIERSEMIINESGNIKRINFNHLNDIKILINIDCKPTAPALYNFVEEFLQAKHTNINYKETTIKKIKENLNNAQKTQISVKEFLDSVKIESDEDYNNSNEDYEIHAEYDHPGSDNDYVLDKKIYKGPKKKAQGKKLNKNNIRKPIKPVVLKDILITHYDLKATDQPKRKYKYPEKKSVCPYCGKLLRVKYMGIHLLLHNNVRPYKCDECSKTFITKKCLDKHIQKHVVTEKFKCNECVACFTTKSSLNSHMLVHSNVRKHICDICNKAFKRRPALRRHLLIHNFGKKSVQCELCPMTFHCKYFLRHHMRVHTGERPYKCEICSQPYSYKHDFNRHCLKKHGVFLKRRSVKVMNEEVLQQERALMKHLSLRAHGIVNDVNLPSGFEGPQGARAFEQAMKAIEARQIPVAYVDTYRV